MLDAAKVPVAALLYAAALTVYEVPEVAANTCDCDCVKPVGEEWFAASLVNPPYGDTIVPLTMILLIMSQVDVGATD